MLEEEDRQKARLMREKAAEITKLEKELGVATDESAPSGGVQFKEGSK
jgi:hypothetical protein